MSALRSSLKRVPKGAYPFRLGTSSYIVPDDILPNVRELAPLVDDIELVLFESPDVSNIPSADEIAELAAIAAEHDLTYTVHFPTDCRAGAENGSERARFAEGAMRIVERCAPLHPHAWVLHLEGVEPDASGDEVTAWTERCESTIARLLPLTETPRAFAVENLAYPWHWHRELVSRFGATLCCDVGHLWVCSPDSWQEQVSAMLPDTSVIHFHGVEGTADHLTLTRGVEQDQRVLMQMLASLQYQGVLTLEVFNEQDFTESAERVADLWEQLHS